MVLEKYMRKQPIFDSVRLENGVDIKLRRPTFREIELIAEEYKEGETTSTMVCAILLKTFCDDPDIAVATLEQVEKEVGSFSPRDVIAITQWYYRVQGVDMKAIAQELGTQDFR